MSTRTSPETAGDAADLVSISCFGCHGTGDVSQFGCSRCAGTGRVFWVDGRAYPYTPEGEQRAREAQQ